MPARYPWLWDTVLENDEFDAVLNDQRRDGSHDVRWAMVRLVDYAPWAEIKRLLPREIFLKLWPEVAPRVRSETRRKGMTFYHEWLQKRRSVNG
jgi:hypothetical protein